MIAYFVYNLNKYSGASQQALLLAKSMKVPITILNHEKGIGFSIDNINDRVRLINLPNNRWLALLYLFHFFLTKKIDVLHLHGFFKHGLLIGRIFRKRIILKTTLMGSDDFQTLDRKFKSKWFFKLLVNCVDVNICLTRQLLDKNKYFIDEKKISLIPNGVEFPDRILTEKDNIFCFVGVVCKRKGTYESIEYFLKNYLTLPGSKMYVVGPLEGTNESDPNYIQSCFDLIAKYSAEDQVVFSGNIEKNKVQDFFRISKALIFFSRNEGMPNVVLEAMANNCLPITNGLEGVVSSMLGDYMDSRLTIIKDGDVVDVKSLDEIIRKKIAVSRAKDNFSIDVIGKKYRDLYEEILL